MARHKIFDTCKICGFVGELSFEHVPPEKAFNNNRFYYEASLEELSKLGISDIDFSSPQIKLRKKQGGIGFNSICRKCNNLTGIWYAKDFIKWVHQSMSILLKANGRPTLYYPTFFFPLRVIKQIVTMFFSVNQDVFRNVEPQLVSFILEKEKRFLDPKYKIYCYYNIEGQSRYKGNSFIGNLHSRDIIHISEISFPPFGFVMTIDSKKPDDRLTDISHFADFPYNHWTDYYQRFNVLPTYLPYLPGDYRTKEEIQSAINLSKKE
jgi:hypothetical protein